MRPKLILFLRMSIGVGLIAAILASIDLSEVASTLTSLDPKWFLILCVLAIFLRVLKSYKWWLLLCARDISISAWQSTRLYFEGNIIGTLTPAGVGSDFYRFAALSNFQKHKDVISTLVIERLIGYTILVATVVLALPFSTNYIESKTYYALWGVIGFVFFFGCILLLVLQLKLVNEYVSNVLIPKFPLLARVKNLISACLEYRHRGSLLMSFAILTALEILVLVIISYAAVRSLRLDISFLFLLAVIPLMQLLIRLPISFQALGIQEGLYIYLLIIAGFTAADGLSVSIILRIVEVMLILLPGVLLLSTRSKVPRTHAKDARKTGDSR